MYEVSQQEMNSNQDNATEPGWIKIGEHQSRAVLKKTVDKIRAKWLDRYELRICPSECDHGFQLQLKHR